MHDVTAINKAAKENGFKEYPGMNYYENLGGGYYETENGKVSKYTLQESIRKMLVNMLFDDGRLGYSHLHSLLQDGKTALGVSLSGEKILFLLRFILFLMVKKNWRIVVNTKTAKWQA